MATYDDWVPIPPYAELQVRIKLLCAEHKFVDTQFHWANMEAHELEKNRLMKLTEATREEMWDHMYMAERGHPCTAKRKRHFHAMCDFQPRAYARKWVYFHLPSDVRAERRARALERWRKAAYLLGVLTFWKHATNKEGSKAARAALERVSKRARVR